VPKLPHQIFLVLGFAALALGGCARPSDLEKALWAVDVRDPYPPPRSPAQQAMLGKPGTYDYELPRAEGRMALRFVPVGASRAAATRALRARGFEIVTDNDEWLQGIKDFDQTWRSCRTEVGFQMSHDRVVDAQATDGEDIPLQALIAFGNSGAGRAKCG
jgi:hypothetical protein